MGATQNIHNKEASFSNKEIENQLEGEWQFRYHSPMYCDQVPELTEMKFKKDVEENNFG